MHDVEQGGVVQKGSLVRHVTASVFELLDYTDFD